MLSLLGCSGEVNHLGNPVLLPISAASTAVDNAHYGARRNRLKRFVLENTAEIHRDILAKGGGRLRATMDIAGVSGPRRPQLKTELFANRELYVQRDVEPLVVALMVHGS